MCWVKRWEDGRERAGGMTHPITARLENRDNPSAENNPETVIHRGIRDSRLRVYAIINSTSLAEQGIILRWHVPRQLPDSFLFSATAQLDASGRLRAFRVIAATAVGIARILANPPVGSKRNLPMKISVACHERISMRRTLRLRVENNYHLSSPVDRARARTFLVPHAT